MRLRQLISAVLLAGSFTAVSQTKTAVKAWQGTLTLPTYEEGLPDPNPPFDVYSTTRFNYPYTLRTNLTGEKHEHAWRAIYLENQYLKCTVLPDIGGHLYTCIDKVSGQSMFYDNTAIKKAQIGYRGAWAAFGVEYNFPVSHNWVSMSPVDFSFAQHNDGSASVTVGNIDRVYGMQWSVELILRPGSTLLEEHVTLYNRSDVRHRYYWWNNAAVRVWDDSRVQYPMRWTASHGFTEVEPWPVVNGKDLSLIGNHTDGPVSLFVHGSREPFMGVWSPHTNTGTAHFSDYDAQPGKKFWSWGRDADGLHWRTALSDDASAYVEVQSGLFRNQETYAFLEPGQTINFHEFWMPVRGTGGISRADKAGVVYIHRKDSAVHIALNVNQTISGAHLTVSAAGKILWEGSAALKPEAIWTKDLPTAASPVSFRLADSKGHILLEHTEGLYDWDNPKDIQTGPQSAYRIPEEKRRSEDDWLQLGAQNELNGKLVQAFDIYSAAVAKYPESFALQMAAGRLAAGLLRYDEAVTLLQAVQRRDTSNAEIGYYLGIAQEGLQNNRAARTAYEIAFRQAELRPRAALKLGEMSLREGNIHQAVSYFEKTDVSDERAQEELAVALRVDGQAQRAAPLVKALRMQYPLSGLLGEEASAPDMPHLAADPERVIHLAAQYMQLGQYKSALALLQRTYPTVPADQSEPGAVLPQNYPMVRYHAAFCEYKLGFETASTLHAAQQLSPDLVFPSSAADLQVLSWAISASPDDAKAQMLLGNLLFAKGSYEAGIQHWIAARKIDPALKVLDASLGKAELQIQNDPSAAMRYLQEGIENHPENPDLYSSLDAAMSVANELPAARAKMLERYPSKATMPANLVYQLALTEAEAGRFEDALGYFQGRFFPSEEGGVAASQVQNEIRLMQAEAAASAGNCQYAKVVLQDDPASYFVNGASAQANLRLFGLAKACQEGKIATERLHDAAQATGAADAVWAKQAGGDVSLQQALTDAEGQVDRSSYTGWWWLNIGLLRRQVGDTQGAKAAFHQAFLLPDSLMSHHWTRVATQSAK